MDLGLQADETGARIDFDALRRSRFERALAAMEGDDLDALILGREANARYVSGARRLWTAGARPFAPSCVVVRKTASVHLVSTWDDGIPSEIPRGNLIQLHWNPENLMNALGKIPRLEECRRIGIDGMTPLFAVLLAATLPNAEWVDGTPSLERARATKTPEEIACLRTAVAVAEGAFAVVAGEIRPGAHERTLTGLFAAEAARLGTPVLAFEPAFCGAGGGASVSQGFALRRVGADRLLEAGEWVRCHAGVLYAGYEGAVGRTIHCGTPVGGDSSSMVATLLGRLEDLRGALRSACVPGAQAREVCAAYAACGEALPAIPVLHGVGLGVEPPLVGTTAGWQGSTLDCDMVVAVMACVDDGAGGALFARDTLRITANGCEALNRS